MKAIIIQGMSCLGKTTLAYNLSQHLPNSKFYSLDKYKEEMWDKHGFSNINVKEALASLAADNMFREVHLDIKNFMNEYYIFDYPFKGSKWEDLMEVLGCNIEKKTIRLSPTNIDEHREVYSKRKRHPAHSSMCYYMGYHNGIHNTYDNELIGYPTIGDCLDIKVSFNPYELSVEFKDILDFCKRG